MLINKFFWTILEFIATTIELVIFKKVLDRFSEPKRCKVVMNLSITLNIFIILILNKMDIYPNYKLIIGIIIGLIFYIYNYKVDLIKGMMISLTYWMGLVFINLVSVNIILITSSKVTIEKLLNRNNFRLELIFVSELLLILIIPILKKIKFNIELKKKEYIYLSIPIIANILSGVTIFTLSRRINSIENKQEIALLIISVILILSNISFIKILSYIVKSKYIDIENSVIKEKMNMQHQLYLGINESQVKVRKLYHDINNHIECLKNLYSKNNECENYIKSIEKELMEYKPINSTGNMILDIIINNKKDICENYNINLKVNINFSKCGFIEIIDVCSIFSNIIDNAIQACKKITDKETFININGTIVNKMFVLKCENSKQNKIKFNKKEIITDKKDEFVHGLGIKSITSSVKKYDGDICIDFTNNKFLIKIYIPLI